MHPLLGMTSLCSAVKMMESCILDFPQAIQLCYDYSLTLDENGFNYPLEMLMMAEFEIFKKLGFNLLIPTPVDIIL